MPIFEIEAHAPNAAGLHFQPLQERIRGRWDMGRTQNRVEQGGLFAAWPEIIPGQIIGIDTETGRGWVRDPLVEAAELAELRKKIEEHGYKLGPARVDKPGVDVVTWSFWMTRAVQAGLAKVVAGPIPKLPGKPRLTFLLEEQDDPRDQMIARLMAVLEALTPAQRARADEMLQATEGGGTGERPASPPAPKRVAPQRPPARPTGDES